MTDNEIIKAFEVFVGRIGKGLIFAKLDLKIDGTDNFKHIALSFDDIFDLINRLKAEIEKLNAELEAINDALYPLPFKTQFDMEIEIAKAEAIKEFAERLKENCKGVSVCNYGYILDEIKKLVKEMVCDVG